MDEEFVVDKSVCESGCPGILNSTFSEIQAIDHICRMCFARAANAIGVASARDCA